MVAIRQTDIKQVLACTTLMALGAIVMFGGAATPAAIPDARTFLMVHSPDKASLFLMTRIVDHGTRLKLPLN